jgi:hypothetical protein
MSSPKAQGSSPKAQASSPKTQGSSPKDPGSSPPRDEVEAGVIEVVGHLSVSVGTTSFAHIKISVG